MADTFAELFGAVFPTPAQTETGVVYGPTGADYTGTFVGGSVGQGNGDNTVVVTVQSGLSAVPGAGVTIRSGSLVVAYGRTNGSGQVTFYLEAGTYSASVMSHPGYEAFTPVAFTVPTTLALTLELTAQTITPPDGPGLSTVRFLVLDAGQPVVGAKCSAELEEDNPMVSSALVARTKHSGTTDADGIADLTMIQLASFTKGGTYHILVYDSAGRRLHDRRVTVPSSAFQYAEDLPDA